MALTPSIIGVGLASVLLGFGHLIFEIASQASVPRYSTDATLDKGFGWQTAGISAGQLLGPLLGGLILGNSSGDERMHLINISLWVGAAFALISIPLMLGSVRASLLVSAIVIALVPLTLENLWISVLSMVVGGFFVGIAQPLTMTMIIKEVPVSWRSPALAVRLTGNRLGQVCIPLIAGAVAAPLGPAGAIWFCCVLIGISGVEKSARYAKTGPTAADR